MVKSIAFSHPDLYTIRFFSSQELQPLSFSGIVRVSQSSRYYVHEERTGNLYRSERRKVGQWPDSRCHGCGCMCTGQKSGTAIDAPNVQPVLHSVLDFCQKLAGIFFFLDGRRVGKRRREHT